MAQSPSRRRNTIIALIVALIVLLLLLLRCSREEPKLLPATPGLPSPMHPSEGVPSVPVPAKTTAKTEVLTPATLEAPKEVRAGAVFSVRWTGPDNVQDYITIVKKGAPEGTYANSRDTKLGNPAELTAPIEAGDWELRYMTVISRTVLARLPITVLATEATIDAPPEGVLGTTISVKWTGPNNPHDYITVVAKETPEGRYGNYTETAKGSPLDLVLPPEAGDAELRYVTGQGARTLARRPFKILAPDIELDAPREVVAGSAVEVSWKGPNNPGDYVTLVPTSTPDGQYGNYTDTKKGSPMTVTAPIHEGEAELRYMTGPGSKVLARRPLQIVASKITMEAPAQVAVGAPLSVIWTGPNHQGDYITVVPKGTKDGQYASYMDTRRGSPAKLTAPKEPGAAEIRYTAGQGSKVLARREIQVMAE